VRVATERLEMVLSLEGGDPVGWRACHPSCARADAGSGTSVRFVVAADSPGVRLVLRGREPLPDLRALRFTAALAEDARSRTVTLRADVPAEGVAVVKSFVVSRDGYEVALTAALSGPSAAAFMADRRLELDLAAGRGLSPEHAAGFAALLERVGRVVVGGSSVRVVGDESRDPVSLRAGDWVGVRGRFWTFLTRSEDCAATLGTTRGPGVTLSPADGGQRLACRYALYSGPLESHALDEADPRLDRLLFSGLWWWLRPLSVALAWLLRLLTHVIGHPGVAIVALAVSVKLLLLPLTAVAGHLQEQVNATQARLQPGIDAIKAAYRGEERTRRTLALYREHGVHPLYTLRSLAGFMIQFPVFIAVFDMLAEDFDLQQASFLWIPDLSRPDALLRLPACIPFFGCDLNALPLLMSGVSLATVLRFRARVLTPALVRRQRRNLTAVSLLFFLLFYTFPAGMVLYWTSTNAVQLIAQELARWWRRA
jgi:YidC/Oxa1 family membrane protein insertase